MWRSTLLLLPSLTLGCVSATESPNDLAGSAKDLTGVIQDLTGVVQDLSVADLSVPAGDLSTQYPSGPYGNSVGAIFPLLVWEGYLDPAADQIATSEAYGPWGSDQLRRSGAAYALVHVSEIN